MTVSDFTPGQQVKLDVRTNKAKGSFDAVVALTYKNILLLEPIIIDGKLLGFPQDYTANLTVIVKNVCYVWSNIQVQAVSFKGRHFHAIELFGEAESKNRRNNFRVPIGEMMNVVYFTESGPKPHHALIKDISETGFAFISKEEFDIGRMVRLNIMLPDKTRLAMSAKIVRCQSAPKVTESLYGCHFSERNAKLSTFLMQLQREKQKKKIGLSSFTGGRRQN
ncbi:MAG: PilZ domain-containing protein [Lachnospiraceae bacterium]|nr:PilZ domain-containing protein [Lachnospiraceae bacterium]